MTTNREHAGGAAAKRRAQLKKLYFQMSRAALLDKQLDDIVDDYDAGVLTGEHFESGGLILTGESGSGKTREIDKALARLKQRRPVLECGRETRVLQVFLDGESTWKAVGLQILEDLGYPTDARRTEHDIWYRVRAQMEGQGIWLLHLDECQHMFQTTGDKETKKIINSLKSRLKNRNWQIVLVLTGIPELAEKLSSDNQLHDKFKWAELPPIDPEGGELDELDTAFCGFAEAVGVDISEVRSEDTYRRMSYGHRDLFGRTFRFMIDVLAKLPPGTTNLTMDHLADRFAERMVQNIPGNNVFLRDDYLACDVSGVRDSSI